MLEGPFPIVPALYGIVSSIITLSHPSSYHVSHHLIYHVSSYHISHHLLYVICLWTHSEVVAVGLGLLN